MRRHRLTVPAGFAVNVFADTLQMPRMMALAPNGDVFVSEPVRGQGAITILRDANRDGVAETRETFAAGLNRPGLAFRAAFSRRQQRLVVRFSYRAGQPARPVRQRRSSICRRAMRHSIRTRPTA
jgi:glucose/arabinose dehydrogenase